MKGRILRILERIRASYWFVPSLMSAAALALAAVALQVEPDVSSEFIDRFPWLAAGTREGARSLLSTVAGSMITVAGVAFSITMVAVAHAASQFGPRLLLTFMRDRANQVTLGTFIATFLYCIVVLSTLRDEVADADEARLALAVLIGLLLCVASLAAFIFFLHHAPESIHVSNVVARVGKELRERVEKAYLEPVHDPGSDMGDAANAGEARKAWSEAGAPRTAGHERASPDAGSPPGGEHEPTSSDAGSQPTAGRGRASAEAGSSPHRAGSEAAAAGAGSAPTAGGWISACRSGYVQAVDVERLVEIARKHDRILTVEVDMGGWVFDEKRLVRVEPADLDPEIEEEVRGAFQIGRHRSRSSEIAFNTDQLVEIAGRALSPGINDPFTAQSCLDWLVSSLAAMSGRTPPERVRRDTEGRPRVVMGVRTFADHASEVFDRTRPYLAGDRNATLYVLELMAELAASVAPADRELVVHHADALAAAGLANLSLERDRRAVQLAHREVARAGTVAQRP